MSDERELHMGWFIEYELEDIEKTHPRRPRRFQPTEVKNEEEMEEEQIEGEEMEEEQIEEESYEEEEANYDEYLWDPTTEQENLEDVTSTEPNMENNITSENTDCGPLYLDNWE